jgi:hypothetical protein
MKGSSLAHLSTKDPPPKIMLMNLDELKDAIKVAKELRAYVPMGEFFMEVKVAKTKVLAALQSRIEEWIVEDFWNRSLPQEYEAHWVEDEPGVLVVGGGAK